MHLIGRWANVREWGPSGWGRPWMLDRKWGEVLPYACDEWWRSPKGLWLPTIRGGAFSGSQQGWNRPWIGVNPASQVGGRAQGVNLANNYTFGSAGNAVGARIVTPVDETIDELFFFINTYGGTAANVNDLNWEVRNGSTGAANFHTVAAGAAIASGTVDPASATGFLRITGINAAITKGQPYFLILGDADGNGTDFAQLHCTWQADAGDTDVEAASFTMHFTTSGWTTGGSAVFGGALCAAICASGRAYGGAPWDSEDSPTSGTYERGLLIDSTVFDVDVPLYGVLASLNLQANFSGLQLWEGTNGPGGSPTRTTTALIGKSRSTGFPHGFMFTDDDADGVGQILEANTQYRLTLTLSSSSAQPRRLVRNASSHANLRKLMPGGGGAYWTHNNAGAWTNDQDKWPKFALLLDNVGIPGGGGGGGLMRANMSGGLL